MITCPDCNSEKVQRRGYNNDRSKQRIECQNPDCGNWNSIPVEEVKIKINEKFENIKIGVIDIEMLPAIFYSWGARDQYLGSGQMIKDVCFLSWVGKYLNSSEVYSDILTSQEALDRNPERIALSAFEFVNSCQILIGHNIRNYDAKLLNKEFLHHAQPVKNIYIDTLEVARSNFRFTSNKLSDINKELGIKQKIENDGFPLWVNCSNGNEQALNTMLSYNIGDVIATESLYYRFRGFIHNHPNLARYNTITTKQCPNCLCEEFTEEGTYPAGQGMFISLRCNECGSLHRYGQNLLGKNKRASLLKS